MVNESLDDRSLGLQALPFLVVLAACLGWVHEARAFQSPYPTSNEAAIAGGAVLASGREVGSLVANPAVLGHVHRGETELNAEALGARWTRAAEAVVLDDGAGGVSAKELGGSELLVVPSSFAMAFALSPRWTLGGGVFAPVLADMDLESASGGPDKGPYLRSRRTAQRYQFGLAVGWAATPRLRLGLSTFAVYDSVRLQQRVFTEGAGALGESASSLSFDRESSTESYGLSSKLGLQAQLTCLVHLGVTIGTPTFVLSHDGSGVQGLTQRVGSSVDTSFTQDSGGSPRPTMLTGWRSSLGLSVGDPSWMVSGDVYGSTPVRSEAAFGWGVRLGARAKVTERVSVGGGLFADMNTEADAGPMAFHGDRWGGSLGFELIRPVRLALGESARTLELRTTIAARYAYEVGTIGGLRIGAPPTAEVLTLRGPATSHLFFVHIGSTIAF